MHNSEIITTIQLAIEDLEHTAENIKFLSEEMIRRKEHYLGTGLLECAKDMQDTLCHLKVHKKYILELLEKKKR